MVVCVRERDEEKHMSTGKRKGESKFGSLIVIFR